MDDYYGERMNKIRQGIRIAIVASLFLLTLSLFLLFLAEYRNASLQRKDAEKFSQINRILEEHQRDISSADDAVAVLAEHGVSDLSLLQREGQIFFRNSDKKCYWYLSMQSKTAGMTLDELLYSVNGVLFALEGEEATLLCFPSGYEGDYSVPTSLRWGGRRYAVTAIAEGAFENAVGLDSLKIPEGVEQRQRGR